MPKGLRASTKRVLRQVWEQGDAALAERRLKALARRQKHDAAGVAGSLQRASRNRRQRRYRIDRATYFGWSELRTTLYFPPPR